MSQDIDKLLLVASSINGLVDIGEEIMKDGKVDYSDLAQIMPLGKEAQKLIEAVKAYKEIVAEIKDIDPAEAIQFIQAIFEKK